MSSPTQMASTTCSILTRTDAVPTRQMVPIILKSASITDAITGYSSKQMSKSDIRLPRPVGTEKSVHLTRGDVEIETIYGDRRPEPFAQTLAPDRIHMKRP
jgi:hypothetical protein